MLVEQSTTELYQQTTFSYSICLRYGEDIKHQLFPMTNHKFQGTFPASNMFKRPDIQPPT